MKQTVHRGYIVTVVSREGQPQAWHCRWSAVKFDGSDAHFRLTENGAAYRTESKADEAGLREGCAWVDAFGKE